VGTVFTGGENFEEVGNVVKNINDKKGAAILNYGEETVHGFVPDEAYYDKNSQILMDSIKCAATCSKHNVISLKMTAIVAHDVLVKINKTQCFINEKIEDIFEFGEDLKKSKFSFIKSIKN